MAFKMHGKSPMMKRLIGKQKNLPKELKDKILAAPENPINYGSPMEMDKEKEKYKKVDIADKDLPKSNVEKRNKNLAEINKILISQGKEPKTTKQWKEMGAFDRKRKVEKSKKGS